MKKIIIAILLSFTFFGMKGQEKGLYLTVGGSLGANSIRYTLDNDNKNVPQLGFGGTVGVQYFFTKHWGIATGIGLTYYNTKGHYSNDWQNDPDHYSFANMQDDDFLHPELQNYTLRLGLSDWTESQKGYFLEIPLMLMYQTKWGASQSWGMYAGVGAKVQLPAFGLEYSVKNNSTLSVSGYIPDKDFPYPDPNGPDLSKHGFGTNSKTGYSGDIDLKTSFAVAGEIGLLKTLSRRVDLTLGVYLDYGLNDIKKGDKTEGGYLISPENGSNTIHPSSYVGDNLQYNGYINSSAVDKANLLAMGGKIGLRIKLGKIPEQAQEGDIVSPSSSSSGPYYTIWVRDSATKRLILAESEMICSNCPKSDTVNFYSSERDPYLVKLHSSNTYQGSFTKPNFKPYHTTIVTGPDIKDINIFVPLRPDLLGNVRTTSNNPLSGVQVEISTPDGNKYNLLTDSTGHFERPSVDAGKVYTVIATKPGYVPDTAYMEIPIDPSILEPSYTVEAVNGMRLKHKQKIVLSALVLFDLDKSTLRAEAKYEINQILSVLRDNPEITIAVDGHTDSRGSAKYNQKLSQDRANSVRDYLIEQNINPKRIKAKGYGYSQPVNKCKPGVKCSEEAHQENRRVEFIFSEKVIEAK